MIQELYDNHVFLYVMGGLCVLGVLIQFFLLIIYNKLIAASENMTGTNRNWLKNMKLRFESSYQLQLGVNDVDTYVDKYVSKIKCGGLLLSTWDNLSGQVIALCLLTGSFAGVLGLVYQCGQGAVIFTFFTGAWTAVIVNIVDNIVNISAHRQMLRYNLIDYFENNLKVRMEQEIFHPEERKQYVSKYFENEDEHADPSTERQDTRQSIGKKKVRGTVILEDESREHKKLRKLKEKELIKLRKREEKEEKARKEQERLDMIQAKKQEKRDEKIRKEEEKKAEKLNRQLAKQELKTKHREEKQERRDRRDEIRRAREEAEIEAVHSKRKIESDLRVDLSQKDRKTASKPNTNSKAYNEKMRLKQEKEREARRQEELLRNSKKQDAVTDDQDFKEVPEREEEALSEKTDMGELTAISKEEDMLIEEVLKDFLS